MMDLVFRRLSKEAVRKVDEETAVGPCGTFGASQEAGWYWWERAEGRGAMAGPYATRAEAFQDAAVTTLRWTSLLKLVWC